MRVLLTGATGFVGAHVLQRLVAAELPVAIVVRAQSDRWRIQHLRTKVVEIVGDVRYPDQMADAIMAFAPDTAIHLAWSGVGNRYRNDFSQIDDNLYGSLALLRLVHAAGCRTWIALGSQAEYGPLNARIDELAPTQPTTLYGTAKLCASMLSERLCEQFAMRFAWLRLFSSYGPMDDPNWMIPYLTLRLLRGERPDLTEGIQRWDYMYVTDVAEAIFRVAITSQASGVFNLGSGEAYTIRSIAERIRDLIDPSLSMAFGAIPYRPDQVMHLQADIGRLRQVAGWSPNVALADGLARTVEWYREHREQFGA